MGPDSGPIVAAGRPFLEHSANWSGLGNPPRRCAHSGARQGRPFRRPSTRLRPPPTRPRHGRRRVGSRWVGSRRAGPRRIGPFPRAGGRPGRTGRRGAGWSGLGGRRSLGLSGCSRGGAGPGRSAPFGSQPIVELPQRERGAPRRLGAASRSGSHQAPAAQSAAASRVPWSMARLASSSAARSAPPMTWHGRPRAASASARPLSLS